ncbi:MAG: hypothetical protein WB052_18150 [Pseudolabrys sp.]
MPERLTLKSATVRSVSVPLRRPVVSKVGLFREWPLILIDLYTNEGVVGRGYLEPYLKQSPRYIIPVIEDLVASQIGKRLAPLDSFQASRRSLNLVGYEGITMLPVSIWRSGTHWQRLRACRLRSCWVGRSVAYRPTTAMGSG